MKIFLLKSIKYTVLILVTLELFIRVLHLTKDYPSRYVDNYGVEKWLPNQEGYSVTGNRRQNFSKFHINSFGYNSYREFAPSKDKIEVALVGDSFIEGFHQDYNQSIGKKIENRLEMVDVYEYGYAGYDLADQLHLIHQYKNQFDLINYVIIGLNFEDDLKRGTYRVLEERMRLESPKFKIMHQIKLLVYLQNIGLLDVPINLLSKLFSNEQKVGETNIKQETISDKASIYSSYLKNFESLIGEYGFDKQRFIFLLDQENTPVDFLTYLKIRNFKYLDFSETLKASKAPTTLIYDMHWNNNGRNLVATLIAQYINTLRKNEI